MEHLAITDPNNASDIEIFHSVAHRVYRDDPVWAPPSEMLWRQRYLQLYQDPNAFALPLVAVERGRPIARCMLQLVPGAVDGHGNPQAWIGFFECQPGFEQPAGAMLAHGEEILRQRGARTAVISKSDNLIAGILTSGFDLPHTVLTNHNPPYYFDLLKDFGYLPRTRMITLIFTRENATRQTFNLPGLRTREFDRRDLDREIMTFHTLQRTIFGGRPGYLPRTYEEDRRLVLSFLPFLQDEFVIIAETTAGDPVGLLVCVPDLYQHQQGQAISRARIITIGAIPAYTHRGVGALMGAHLLENLVNDSRYMWVEGSWILSHNLAPQNLAKRFNALPGKEYWLLEKDLG